MVSISPTRIAFGIILGIAAASVGITARADVMTSYSVTIDSDAQDVTGVVVGEMLLGGAQRVVFPFDAPAGETTQINPVLPIANEPLGSVLLGVIEDATVFGGGDVVLMISDAAAALAEGQTWEELFPQTREADIAASLLIMASDIPLSEKFDTILFVQQFIQSSLGLGIWDPATQTLVPYMFEVGDSFSVLKFSGNVQIGHGTSRFLGAVPEPASAALLGIGGLMGGLVLRHRQRMR